MSERSIKLHSRLGIFNVGDKKHFSKYQAFIDATKRDIERVTWNFNDEVFTSINWDKPISASLKELYKARALQLRMKYDYVILYFSGGVDSANMVKAFLDNGIFIDEIAMFKPSNIEKLMNNVDRSAKNIYSEINFAAIPWLKQQNLDPRTKVRIMDMNEHLESFIDSGMMDQYKGILGPAFTPNSFCKNVPAIKDPQWMELYKQGKKVCHVQGLDKPLIKLDQQNRYYFQFHDHIAWYFEPEFDTPESILIEEQRFVELFYWSPDLPELAIKQCQIVKAKCESDTSYKETFSVTGVLQDHYIRVIELLYPADVNNIRDMFCTNTAGMGLYGTSTDWFHENMSKKIRDAFWKNVQYMRENIADRFWMSLPENGQKAIGIEDVATAPADKKAYRIARSMRHYL